MASGLGKEKKYYKKKKKHRKARERIRMLRSHDLTLRALKGVNSDARGDARKWEKIKEGTRSIRKTYHTNGESAGQER